MTAELATIGNKAKEEKQTNACRTSSPVCPTPSAYSNVKICDQRFNNIAGVHLYIICIPHETISHGAFQLVASIYLHGFMEVAVDDWEHEESTCTAKYTKSGQNRGSILRLEVYSA